MALFFIAFHFSPGHGFPVCDFSTHGHVLEPMRASALATFWSVCQFIRLSHFYSFEGFTSSATLPELTRPVDYANFVTDADG